MAENNTNTPLIETSAVGFTYQGSETPALQDVTLSIGAGECVLLCGKSGCGKTTFTRLLNGLAPAFFPGRMLGSCRVGGLLAGMRVTCVCPEGYRPAADVLMFAHRYGEKFHLLTDPAEGVKDADVVVTAAWNTAPGTPESERRLRDFAGFQVTSRLMEGAKPDAMLLHCLPAHRGEEISTAVFEEHADEIFDEAENRLHVQKAVLAILLAGL